MNRFPKAYALSIAAGGFLLMTAPAIHAETTTSTPQQVAQAAQTEFGDQKLQQYAEAVTQIQELNVEWQQRIQQTEDPGKAQELRQTANEEMVGAIREEGLTLEEYNQITDAATNDPELRNKITQHLQ
ncbi:DUF4168 domain-containing protein [Thalassospira lucentensis]|uniref:DUF4168 domain-containing protein n=1 Tax=Thalassospira lucentensis TaxID=168935 RepID=UPI003D2F2CD3